MLRKMITMAKEELGLEGWFPTLGPYLLKNKVGMRVACVTFRLYIRKEKYAGHLQWETMKRALIAWANIYGSGVLGMEDTIVTRDSTKFTENACTT